MNEYKSFERRSLTYSMNLFARYRQAKLLEWVALLFFNVTLIYYFIYTYSSGNLYVLIALWCLTDLIEIKSLIKVDMSTFMLSPKSFKTLFGNIVLTEFYSVKFLSVLISGLFLYFYGESISIIFLLMLVFISQLLITIIAYHITNRYTKYSTLIRYLYLTPLILLFIAKSVVLNINVYNVLEPSIFFAVMLGVVVLIFVLTYFLVNKIIHTTPFMHREYLDKIKKRSWSW